MMSCEASDSEAGEYIAKATLQNQTSDKRRRTGCSNSYCRCSSAGIKHLLRRQWGVALSNHSMMMRRVLHGVMKKIAFEHLDARAFAHLYRLMYLSRFPAASIFSK